MCLCRIFTVHQTGSSLKSPKTSVDLKQLCLTVCLQSLPAKPAIKTLNAQGIQHHTLPPASKGPQDYDSGNDTSSPPSTKTGVSRVNGIGDKMILCPALASLEKQKFPEGDNASDSGNSVTSYASLCKTLRMEGGLVSCILHRNCKR